jgi:uncharacterized protein (TIGR03083 family)
MSAWPGLDVRHLYAPLLAKFTGTLGELTDAEWAAPTACPGWTVKDLTAHVLGDHVGRLSRHRDGYQAAGPEQGETLPAFLDRINEEWVVAARRMSPRVLTRLFADVGDEITEFWRGVDMSAPGEPVSWAGPEPAPVWLDAARDFTEIWTHYQQICEATGRQGASEYLGPVIATFMHALPHTMKDVAAEIDTAVVMKVDGRQWWCVRGPAQWQLRREGPHEAAATIRLDADTAWRLCTRGIDPEQAAARALIEGDQALAEAALRIVSIIWAPARP